MIVETLLPLKDNGAAIVELDMNLLMNRPDSYLQPAIRAIVKKTQRKLISEGTITEDEADEEMTREMGKFLLSFVRYHEGRRLATRRLEDGVEISEIYFEALDAMARLSGMLSVIHDTGDSPICTEVVTGLSDYSGMVSYQGHLWGQAIGDAIEDVGVGLPVTMERQFDGDFPAGDSGFSRN